MSDTRAYAPNRGGIPTGDTINTPELDVADQPDVFSVLRVGTVERAMRGAGLSKHEQFRARMYDTNVAQCEGVLPIPTESEWAEFNRRALRNVCDRTRSDLVAADSLSDRPVLRDPMQLAAELLAVCGSDTTGWLFGPIGAPVRAPIRSRDRGTPVYMRHAQTLGVTWDERIMERVDEYSQAASRRLLGQIATSVNASECLERLFGLRVAQYRHSMRVVEALRAQRLNDVHGGLARSEVKLAADAHRLTVDVLGVHMHDACEHVFATMDDYLTVGLNIINITSTTTALNAYFDTTINRRHPNHKQAPYETPPSPSAYWLCAATCALSLYLNTAEATNDPLIVAVCGRF